MWDEISLFERSQVDSSPWTQYSATDEDLQMKWGPEGMLHPTLLLPFSAIWCSTCSLAQRPQWPSHSVIQLVQPHKCCSSICFSLGKPRVFPRCSISTASIHLLQVWYIKSDSLSNSNQCLRSQRRAQTQQVSNTKHSGTCPITDTKRVFLIYL